MKFLNKIIVYLILSLIGSSLSSQILNQEVVELRQSICIDSIKANISHLESYETRYTFHPNRVEIVGWLKDKLDYYGFETRIDSFYMEDFEFPYNSGIINNEWQYNLIAELRGIYSPDTVIIIGAHYDAYGNRDTNYYLSSPGADDNASGVSALLQIARLYHKHGLRPIKTLRLELYAIEEAGLIGSDYAAGRSVEGGVHIGSMINFDMLGYSNSSLEGQVKLIEYEGSEELTEFAAQVAENYTDLEPIITGVHKESSDSYSYYAWGMKTLFIHESGNYPFYHTSKDILANLNTDYLKKTVEYGFILAYLSVNTNDYYPVSIEEIEMGEGESFTLLQNPSKNNISFVYSGQTEKKRVVIQDLFGRVVWNQPLGRSGEIYNINSPMLETGTYIISIGNKSHKLVYIKE